MPEYEDFENIDDFAVSDEEMSFKLVKLYFEEIARLGFKRSMDLDAIINAYFYTLLRLKRKKKEMGSIMVAVEDEEEELDDLAKKDKLFPSFEVDDDDEEEDDEDF